MERDFITTITVICILLFIILLISSFLAPQSNKVIVNGNPFPSTKNINIQNISGSLITSIIIQDSNGNTYNVPSTFTLSNLDSILVDISSIDDGGSVFFYAFISTGQEIWIQLINTNNKIRYAYLLGTSSTSIQFSLVNVPATYYAVQTYMNTIYPAMNILQTSQTFPNCISFTNQTNMTITQFYIFDSMNHTYYYHSTPFPKTIYKTALSMNVQGTLYIEFTNPITPSNYVEMYIVTSNGSYIIVLYNEKGNVYMIYPANIDSSAFLITNQSGTPTITN